jgi:hypothetical protein
MESAFRRLSMMAGTVCVGLRNSCEQVKSAKLVTAKEVPHDVIRTVQVHDAVFYWFFM